MKKIILSAALIAASFTTYAQVGVGTTTPHASAELDVTSTTKGFLPPRMTKVQMEAIATPAEGLIVYCLDCSPKGIFVNNGGAFVSMVNPNQPNVPTGVTLLAGEVYSTTGKIWMDKNLGAVNVAASSTDYTAYGDLYQWGRAADGHQVVVREVATLPNGTTLAAGSSTTVVGPFNDEAAAGANFITNITTTFDWLNTVTYTQVLKDARWNSGTEAVPVKVAANDPCPAGYRVPTATELNAEVSAFTSNNVAGAYASPLKLPVAGNRSRSNGLLYGVGSMGLYWTSTVSGTNALGLIFNSSTADVDMNTRANGFSVRCIKE